MRRLAAALLVTLSLVTLAWAQQSTRQLSIGDRVNPGAYARVTHANELIVNCAVGCSASTFDSVNVFHQSTIRHVSSVTHVAGGVMIRDSSCATCNARVDHYNILVTQPHISGALRTWQVSQCGTTASLAVNTNENRRDLWLMNRGNGNIYIGYGTTGHVALTTGNGWPIHATASAITTVARHSTALSIVYLQNYQGPIACIADLAGQAMQVMEILR